MLSTVVSDGEANLNWVNFAVLTVVLKDRTPSVFSV